MAATEPMLQTELWVSFVSMLRAYAAAASLHAGEVLVRATENGVAIEAGDAQLAIRFDAETGTASWSKRVAGGEPVEGSFAILEAGVVSIHGVERDLDHAAIDFIGSVTESAKGGAR